MQTLRGAKRGLDDEGTFDLRVDNWTGAAGSGTNLISCRVSGCWSTGSPNADDRLSHVLKPG